MTDGAFPDRLTQLKSRWEADPTSRIFLQLAEEYRHQGRVKEALGVLDRGLREHPGYLSALVAKGRCHLELGEPEMARTVLERVVKQDATQMVANKLLVRAYLDTGEPERARERLDLYSLLTESDPETEELRRRLRAMEQPPQAPPTSDPFPAASPPPRAAASGDIFDLGPAAAPAAAPRPAVAPRPDEPFADLWTPPPAAAPAPAPAAASSQPEEPEPADVVFPGLASRERRSRYLDALSSEGLFFPDLAPAAAAPEVSWEAIAEVVPAPAVLEPAWEPEPLAAPEWSAPEIVEPEPAFPEMEEEPARAAAAPPAEEAPVFEIDERTPWSAEPEPVAPEPVVPEPPPAPAAGPVATVTLAELYLRQGHRGEAERIYREVLRREPDNEPAREGLAALPPAEHRPLEARDLLAGYEPGEEGGEAEVKARKVFLLTSYLQRLRQGGQRDVS